MQKFENEVTVKVNCDYKTLDQDLLKMNFKIVKQFLVHDFYYAKKDTDFRNCDPYQLFNDSMIVREMVGMQKEIIHKYKEYDQNKNIINQVKTACTIESMDDGKKLLEAMGYELFLTIDDQCYVYSNEDIELIVQVIEEDEIYIELEDIPRHTHRVYQNIDQMIIAMNEVKIDFDHSDYFVKKQIIAFKSKYQN